MSDAEAEVLVWSSCVKQHEQRVLDELKLLERAIAIRERKKIYLELGLTEDTSNDDILNS